MVDWKRNAEDFADDCESKEEAFLAGASFAIGVFREDLAILNSADMKNLVGLRDDYQLLKRRRKEKESP